MHLFFDALFWLSQHLYPFAITVAVSMVVTYKYNALRLSKRSSV